MNNYIPMKITLIAIITLAVFSGNLCNMAKKNYTEIHVIPDNYKGRVLIIFNQKDGKDVDTTGDTIFFKIDETGILKTKFPKFQESSVVSHFFYKSEMKIPIPEWTPMEKESIKSGIGVFNGGTGEELINNKMEIIEEYYIGDSRLYLELNRW